jgi:hypothetical protein
MLRLGNTLRIILITAAVLVPAMCARADFGPFADQTNEYLEIMLGQFDHTHVGGAAVPRAGRWGIWTVKGDPETTGDDSQPITIPSDDGGPGNSFGYTVIRVDGSGTIFGDQTGGSWNMVPFASSPNLGHYDERGRNGFYIYSEYLVKTTNIVVKYKMSIVRDQVRFWMQLVNTDTAPHSVGLMQASMPKLGLAEPPLLPYIPGRGFVTAASVYSGTSIPDYFEIYDDRQNPTFGLRNSMKLEDCTPPDRFGIGTIAGTLWDYTPVPDRDVVDSWGMWWDPITLNPGESRTIISYVGMAAASSSWTSSSGTSTRQEDPFCLAVQGPKALPINYDASQTPDNMLQTNPFQVKAYVYNLDRVTPLTNINAYITLSDGLELADGTSAQTMSTIAPEKEGTVVTWDVKANGKTAGELVYWVSVSGSPGMQKTVKRTIIVPATSTTKFRQGWQLVSIPFQFGDPRIEQALNFAPDTYQAFYYDPDVKDYRPVSTVAPGGAFWLYSNIERSVSTVALDGKAFSGLEPKNIVLHTGWNQFGNPFLYNIAWGRVQVWQSAQLGPITLDEAVARNMIRRTIYWYDPIVGQYQYSSDPQTWLVPWQGYWIKALQPCQLIMPIVQQVGEDISGSTTRSVASTSSKAPKTTSSGWKLQVVARTSTGLTGSGALGIDTKAADGYDIADVERPPAIGGDSVAISFNHQDWGTDSGSYMTDIRRSVSGTTTWEFTTTCTVPKTDVVLTWPTLSQVPKGCSVKLYDLDAGVTKYMRTTSSYRYNTGTSLTRRFKIVAESANSGRLVITGLSTSRSRATGATTISYNLSADASTDVVIKTTSGDRVKTLAQGKGVTRGINSLTWNCKSDDNKSVAAGLYVMEIVATTPEGEVAKAIHPFQVTR